MGAALQSFERESHFITHVKKVMIEVRFDRITQHRIAVEAGGDRLQLLIILVAHRVRRFVKQKELVLQ